MNKKTYFLFVFCVKMLILSFGPLEGMDQDDNEAKKALLGKTTSSSLNHQDASSDSNYIALNILGSDDEIPGPSDKKSYANRVKEWTTRHGGSLCSTAMVAAFFRTFLPNNSDG